MPESPVSRPGTPPSLLAAAVLVALEGAVLALVGVLAASNVAEDRLEVSVSVSVFFVAFAAGLLAAAWALSRSLAWARGPALITQLLQLGIAWNVREEPAVAVPLAVAAVLALVAMLHPATVAALDGAPDPDQR